MIFLTVGTLFPFDRLVKAIDKAVADKVITEDVFAQIGREAYKPKNFDSAEVLDKHTYDSCVINSSSLISHAGMGSIAIALNNNKPLLVMPRMHRHREHINDHQIETAKKFEMLGHILAAYQAGELADKLIELRTFVPTARHIKSEPVVEKISQFLTRTYEDH